MVASQFSVVTANSNYPAAQIIAASYPPQPVLVVNNDPANTVWVAGNNSFIGGDVNHSTPIAPQASVSFDGNEDVYVSTAAGLTAQVLLYPTGSSYAATAGITALTQAGSVTGTPAATLVAGTSYQALNLASIAGYASYDLNMYVTALSPGGVDAVLTAQVQLQWYDDTVSGIPVFEEDWDIWAGRAAPVAGSNTLSGSGPMHGKYLTVNVFIPPSAAFNATLQYISIFGSNRVVPYSDWRQSAGVVNPQTQNFTIIPQANLGFDNIIGAVSNLTLTASANWWMPLGVYSGPVYYRFDPSAAITSGFIISAQYLLSSQIVATASCPGILKTLATTAGESTGTLLLPRGPCALVLATSTSAPTISFECIAQQAA